MFSAYPIVPLLCVASMALFEFIYEFFFFYSPFLDMIAVMNGQVFGSYFVGFVFYYTMIPERWYPGRFDYFGNSHQMWHLAVTAGAFLHYRLAIHYHEHFIKVCI
jgi:adiponectin receptor